VAAGGLAVLLVALRQRRFAGMAHGFRLTLMLAVAGAGLLTVWVLGSWGYQASQRVLFAQTVEELRNVGGIIETELHDGITFALERLQNLAGELGSDVAHGNRTQLQGTLRSVQRFNPRFLQVTVYNAQEAMLVSSSLTDAVEPPNHIAVAFNLEGKSF